MKSKTNLVLLLTVVLTVSSGVVLHAATKLNSSMQALLDSYAVEAKKADPGFKGFSAEAGKKLFFSKRMHSVKKKERSCTTCHTQDPGQPGRTNVGKRIEPISPAVNKERFTDPKKVKKWFKRNCKWVLERECTPVEKGNYISFMTSL